MLQNNIELDVKTKCIEQKISQHQVAEDVGTSGTYVSRQSLSRSRRKTAAAGNEKQAFSGNL